MIQVNVIKKGNEYYQITVSGHAFSNDPGFDLVCAGVSSIATGALNGFDALDKSASLSLTDEPFIGITCNQINEKNQLLMAFLHYQLKTIEAAHKEHLKITVKEEFR